MLTECEVYRYTINNEWEVTSLSVEYSGDEEDFKTEASFYLSEMITSPKVLFAILFITKKNKLKPKLLSYYSIKEKAVLVKEFESRYVSSRWITNLNTDKLFELLNKELEEECPEIINGYNIDYLLEA